MLVKAEKNNVLFYTLSLSHLPDKPRNKFHQGYKCIPVPVSDWLSALVGGWEAKEDFQYKTTSDNK